MDERLRALRGEARALAAELRDVALDLDRDPDAIRRHLGLGAVAMMATFGIPPGYNGSPVRIGPHRFYGTTSLELVVAMEELAVGDAGTLLGAPGPSLSGAIVADLADEGQRDFYYGRLLERPTWTCFALTEPARGSAAAALQTSLAPDGDGFLLTGAKRYIGNGARAALAVVFARTRPGPLGVTAVLLDTAVPGFRAEPLRTLGLRGAQLSALAFDAVRVAPEQVVGRHRPATRRGLVAAVRAFNRLRPLVAATALGVARAAHEYVVSGRRDLRAEERWELDRLAGRLAAVRCLIHKAAATVDRDPSAGYLASAAKARAALLAEEATLLAPRLFGPGARLEHPLLDKLARDARGFEFMEGTGHIQRLNLFNGFNRGRV